MVPADEFVVRMSGIGGTGGTGVFTVSQIAGTAAMLDGRIVRGLDQTGLSQKAGPVLSDIRIARFEVPASNRANAAGVVDQLGAASLAEAVAIAELPDLVRGYEHIKLARAATYRQQLVVRTDSFG